MQDLVGETIGGCKIESKLGQGGMGAVYRGTQVSLGREVAVKVIAEAYMANDQAVARFEREARSVAQLNHPNIVQVYDLGRAPSGQYYIVMEFVDGKSLSDILKTKGAISEREVLTMVRQAAKGLQVAAEKSIIHRDIKPDNLMITRKGMVKVADFGLAKETSSSSQLTATGHVMGTPAYIAPEQGDGRVADHRSDIYSLGATMYAMLTGHMPYTGETPIAIVLQHIQAPVPDPRDKNPAISEQAAKIVRKMMAKQPEDRYQGANELIHDIDVVLGVARDGERLIADGGAFEFDESPTMMDGSILLEHSGDSGRAETLMEVASPTPHTIDAGMISDRQRRVRAKKKSPLGLILGIGGGVAAVAVLVVLGVLFLGDKEQPAPKPPDGGTKVEDPDSKGETKTDPGATKTDPGETKTDPGETKTDPGETKTDPGETKTDPGETKVETPTPPAPTIQITILMPATGSFHMNGRIAVKGRCGVEAKTLQINGKPAALGLGGVFREVLDLAEGANDIKVEAFGEANAKGEAIVAVVVDTTPPVISIPSVAEGDMLRTNKSPFTLEGTVEDLNPGKIVVAGQSASLQGDGFSGTVYLDPGDNRILVTADDKAGNQSASRVRIFYDPNPPGLAVEEVPGRIESTVRTLTIQGRVDEELESLKLNDQPVTVGEDGSFSLSVELVEGGNAFSIVARDLSGNESSRDIAVEYKALLEGFQTTEDEGVYVWERDGAPMRTVPVSGSRVGSDEGAPEAGPAHPVTLSPYFLDKTEVTNGQYRKFLDATKIAENPHAFCHPEEPAGKDHTPAFWDDPDFNKPNQPVVGVDWFDAWAYAKWAGKDLPTEAEWEAAASAGFPDAKPRFPWGDEEPGRRANYGDAVGFPSAVGSYPDGATPLGLMDLAGNVMEWCADWYDPGFYASPEAANPDPVNLKPSTYKVLRGGHFLSPADRIQISARSYFFPTGRYETVGFRCVVRLKAPGTEEKKAGEGTEESGEGHEDDASGESEGAGDGADEGDGAGEGSEDAGTE